MNLSSKISLIWGLSFYVLSAEGANFLEQYPQAATENEFWRDKEVTITSYYVTCVSKDNNHYAALGTEIVIGISLSREHSEYNAYQAISRQSQRDSNTENTKGFRDFRRKHALTKMTVSNHLAPFYSISQCDSESCNHSCTEPGASPFVRQAQDFVLPGPLTFRHIREQIHDVSTFSSPSADEVMTAITSHQEAGVRLAELITEQVNECFSEDITHQAANFDSYMTVKWQSYTSFH